MPWTGAHLFTGALLAADLKGFQYFYILEEAGGCRGHSPVSWTAQHVHTLRDQDRTGHGQNSQKLWERGGP